MAVLADSLSFVYDVVKASDDDVKKALSLHSCKLVMKKRLIRCRQ